MSEASDTQPPYTITPAIVNLIAEISEAIGRLTILTDTARHLRLRRINHIRIIRGSLAIEGNTLSEAQITAILDGKRVIAQAPTRFWGYEMPLSALGRGDRTWKRNCCKRLFAIFSYPRDI